MRPIFAALAAACALSCVAHAAPPANELVNVAGFANGGIVESSTSNYPGWEADYLLDENPATGWADQKGAKPPFTIVISLAERSTIQSLSFDDGEDGDGRAAKDVDIFVSDQSIAGGYVPVASVSLKERANGQKFPLKSPATGRWIKLVIRTNHGSKDYIELMEFRALGRMLTRTPPPANVSGTYSSHSYGTFHLLQKGAELSGCYSGGLIQGGLENHLMRLTWTEQDKGGPALMVLRRDGKGFDGWWQHTGDTSWKANWDLTKISDDVGSCANWNPKASVIASELAGAGRSRLYGINFDLESDRLRTDAMPEVEELSTVMKADTKLRLSIEGHTDSTGTAAHNLDLSKRRAEAVRSELVRRGIPADRMTSTGFGDTKPIAANNTEIGRAQNRRVEAVKQ